ncbi:hypothetical protein L3Q82_010107, partial [Scortum barcoo]
EGVGRTNTTSPPPLFIKSLRMSNPTREGERGGVLMEEREGEEGEYQRSIIIIIISERLLTASSWDQVNLWICVSGMFCFCLQSSLLKLQALEVEGGPSLGPSPEESHPALGSKEQKGPCSPVELGVKEGKTLALCHSAPADENSPPELLTVLNRPPQSPRHQPLTTIHPGQRTPDGAPPPSPHHSPYSPQRSSPGGEGGGGGGEAGGGALLQLLAGGPSPLPSPRCSNLSHSLRFNSDPDTAPSPPCSQQYIQCRGRGLPECSEDECSSSIPFLSRQIQTLKKKVRRFEDQFEQEMNYKPSHNDKYSNPEMIRVMSELAKARKQLKELRLRQSVFESKEPDGPENLCRYSSGQQGASEHKPTLEETVESLFRRLREKRQALGLPDNMKEMTQAQMVLEKITLQKCLLYFESLHGRPGTRQEKNLVKPLYDRYQLIKRLLCVSPTITTIRMRECGECGVSVVRLFFRGGGGGVQSGVMPVVSSQEELEKLTRRHAVKVLPQAGCSVEEVGSAVGEVVGFESVKSASRMNSAVVIFLDEVVKVERVVEAGIVLRDTFTPVYPLVNPSKKITVSNAPPFIKNDDLSKALSRYGQIVSPIKMVLLGCKSPKLKACGLSQKTTLHDPQRR